MRLPLASSPLAAVALYVAGFLAPAAGATGPAAPTDSLANGACIGCHDSAKSAAIEVPGHEEGETRKLGGIEPLKFARGVHGEMKCIDCHTEIVDARANHAKKPAAKAPDCVSCHEALWEKIKKDGLTAENERLGLVVQNAEAYKSSLHATADKDEPWHPKAYCEDCHSSHSFAVPPRGSARRLAWHKSIPQTCGAKCHEDELEEYTASIHGEEVLDNGNVKAAVCTDCHTSHSIGNTSSDKFKLANVDACGSCHQEEFRAYHDTYHGQVNRLGYTYTARCINCHGSHDIRAVDDPNSKVSAKNRLETCQQCHSDQKRGMHSATAGYTTFGPHANTYDFKKYPQMYLSALFMRSLLVFVFAFFWAHSGLWYYREWRDRKEGKHSRHVNLEGLGLDTTRHFQRFPLGWRIVHLCFALVVMTLVLTGTTALFAHTRWAAAVAGAMGGANVAARVHHIAAALFIGIFFCHFVYVMQKLLRKRGFRWFGPDSLVPNWKDVKDCIGMFKWFLGKGPRPQFERFAYYEKFDYWAVFWGTNIIGWSGLMLAFPHITARLLPGWVFNVATLVHGEEAFLAAVFLFTVHFFNNHFRPDKLPPPDVVMFTGTQSLEEFRADHPAQFQRLLDSGELQKRLVDAPSRAMHIGSVILGLTLITIGLALLVTVAVGFFTAH
jgi:cytochrome b subunit of formate dehydrogenase